jgi:tetratricopeptide repeat protein
LGDDHPDTLTSAGNLAGVLFHLGERQQARELAEDTLARQRRALGDDHPSTLQTAYNVTVVLLDGRNLLAARKLAARTLDGYKKTLGRDHPDTKQMAQLSHQISTMLGGQPRTSRPKDRKKKRR